MHKIDLKVKQELWEKVADEFRFCVNQFCFRGAKREKGQSAKQALARVMNEAVKEAFCAGLDLGYDMAAHVYAETLEVPRGK